MDPLSKGFSTGDGGSTEPSSAPTPRVHGRSVSEPDPATDSLNPSRSDPGAEELPRFTAGCLARFKPIRLLGRGGMGAVYLMQDLRLQRLVAVKILQLATSRTEEMVDLVREARAAAALNHPNVVTVYDVVSDDAHPYMVCEFVEGETVARCRHGFATAPVETTIDLVVQVLDGLAAAHDLGIIHQDLKPANILLRHDGVAKIADFGLARLSKVEDVPNDKVAGTPAYMSPEQCQGQPTVAASDLYAVGLILFELLTGNRPFPGPSNKEFVQQHSHADPPVLHQARPGIPVALSEVAGRLLAKDLSTRYGDARSVADALRAIRSKLPVSGCKATAAAKRRRRIAAGVFTFLLLCLAARATQWFERPKPMPWPALLSPPIRGNRAAATAELTRALDLEKQGLPVQAEVAFIQAIHADEAWSAPHMGRAELALQEHQVALARGEYQMAALLSTQPGPALLGYGRTLLVTGRLADASAYIRMALEWDENSAPAHAWLAEVYRRQGDKKAGLEELRRAVAADPESPDTAMIAGHFAPDNGVEPGRSPAEKRP